MDNSENKLSEYIDKFNSEFEQEDNRKITDSRELEKLYGTVRLVGTLKEPVMPGDGYAERLAQNVMRRLDVTEKTKHRKKSWYTRIAAVAAVLIIALTVNFVFSFGGHNYAYAMEKAFEGIKAYHGYLEIASTDGENKTSTQAKLEVWADKEGHYYVKELEGADKGLITVNNGQKKWQVGEIQGNINGKKVYVFPAFPDSYKFGFEIGKEIDQAKNALSVVNEKEETIAGRKAAVLKMTPKGGEPYYIWVDKETKLPLKKQSAVNNALRYTMTYTKIEFADTIPADLLAYKIPDGYTEAKSSNELAVSTIKEAQDIAGFTVKVPGKIPSGYVQTGITEDTNRKSVNLYYSKDKNNADTLIVLMQGTPQDKVFKPAAGAITGKMGSIPVEIQSPVEDKPGILDGSPYAGVTGLNSIRWYRDGREYAVIGSAPLETLMSFAESLSGGTDKISISGEQPFKPQINVPVDLEIAKNDQKNVDGGHSPWQLDPKMVAQVFVSLKISPEGIQGEYPIKYEDLKIIQNNGVEAIIEVEGTKTPVRRVYLKRLVRQDPTGIWSVVGYDPVKK